MVSDKIEGLEPGQIHEVDQVCGLILLSYKVDWVIDGWLWLWA